MIEYFYTVCSQSRTCTSLDQFIANTNASLTTCTRDVACSMITCNTVGVFVAIIESSKITLQPCTIPPSVRLRVVGPNFTFDSTIDTSTEVPLPQLQMGVVTINVSLLIVLNSSIPSQIGLEVSDFNCSPRCMTLWLTA